MQLAHTAHVPAGDGPHPTILALHGWGASAHDLLGLAPYFHAGQALVLCPQGPIAFEIGPGLAGYGWFPLSEGRPPDPEAVAQAPKLVRAFLDDALERYPIDRRKLIVLGFSQGGVIAYDLALRDPERFAGLVALSSWFPSELSDSIAKQPAHESLPTLVIHGSRDPMIPVARAQESRARLLEFGVPLTYREFDTEHEIGIDALRTLVSWVEEKSISPVVLA
ncbi:MAG: alpha/beta fold hydrolase [Deltaproteobacteria bacterium]|nr:MAG: alpha/beta fold hydrolase [Deltaproteobacteria bacterium]